MLEDFTINNYKSNGELIGSGSFANVCKGYNITTGEPVAIKIIKSYFEKKSDKYKNQIDTEIKIIKSLNHNNIVNCYGVYRHPINNSLCIIMEYCDGGTLENYINNKGGKLSEYYTQQILKELIKGLKYLKNNNIIHRDLKPDNLLIKYNYIDNKKIFTLKIADFGLSRFLSSENQLVQTQCGSRLYMAPEIYRGEPYSYKADLWSVGSILYRIIIGKPLFSKLPPIQKFSIYSQLFNPNLINNNNISENCLNLLTNLLQNNPVNRIEWNEFINHPFLTNYINQSINFKDNVLLEFCIIDKNSDTCDNTSIISQNSFISESEKYDINLNDDELKLLNNFDINNSLFLNNKIINTYIYEDYKSDCNIKDNTLSENKIESNSYNNISLKIDKLACKIENNYNYILAIIKLAEKKYKYNYFNDVYIIYKYVLLSIKNILSEIKIIITKNKKLETKKVIRLTKQIYNTFKKYYQIFKNIKSNIDIQDLSSNNLSHNIIYIIITYILSYTKKAELALMFNKNDIFKKKLTFCINCLKYIDIFLIPIFYNNSSIYNINNMDISSHNSQIDNYLYNILKNKKLTIILIKKYISSMLSFINLINNKQINKLILRD
jgi:serine/threonine-protein kinase ULK2